MFEIVLSKPESILPWEFVEMLKKHPLQMAGCPKLLSDFRDSVEKSND